MSSVYAEDFLLMYSTQTTKITVHLLPTCMHVTLTCIVVGLCRFMHQCGVQPQTWN